MMMEGEWFRRKQRTNSFTRDSHSEGSGKRWKYVLGHGMYIIVKHYIRCVAEELGQELPIRGENSAIKSCWGVSPELHRDWHDDSLISFTLGINSLEHPPALSCMYIGLCFRTPTPRSSAPGVAEESD